MEAIKERGFQLLSLIVLVAGWEVGSLIVGAKILPPPADVFPRAGEILVSGEFIHPILTSLVRLLLGFALALAIGAGFGITSAQLRRFGVAATMVFTIIMTMPSLVIILVAMMMLGQSDATVILLAGLIVFPFVAVPLRDAMKDIDQDILSMADSFKISTIRKIVDVYIPYLIPPILAASRIAFSLSWKVVILSEVFGFTTGIGWQISLNYFHYDMEALIAWLVIFVVIILLIEQTIRIGERRVVKWQ
jgi:NitT/TauT family transport system permease protein